MNNSPFTLYIEINNTNFIFFVKNNNKLNELNNIYKKEVSLLGIKDNSFYDLEKTFNLIKENIYSIEQKFNYTFNEIILILENFDLSFINLTGFKKLNGSQILRENITYILNTLKSYVNETEPKKKILHIFNSKYFLDNKKIENLPIGLFGDFYSHELCFNLININNYKNLKNIFENCNIRINRIFLKSYIKGSYISEKYNNAETFFHISVSENNSKIFLFENNSLKFEQDFKFGTNIIIKDISKVTSLSIDTVISILKKIRFNEDIAEDELINKDFFLDNDYKKIKKKLFYNVASARINELLEIMIFENINLRYHLKTCKNLFLEFKEDFVLQGIKTIYERGILLKKSVAFKSLDYCSKEHILDTTEKLVHFGWKKEAIPVIQSKKSLIVRFFEAIFG